MWRTARPKLPPPACSPALAVASLLLTAGLQAHAQAPSGACNPAMGYSRVYLDCLGDTQKISEQQLDRAVAGAKASVEARGELAQFRMSEHRTL